MDTGTILGLAAGYVAAMAGIFALYLPVILLIVVLLVAGGLLQLVLLPFIILVRKLRRRPPSDIDPAWLLDRSSQG